MESSHRSAPTALDPEQVAYWFFRLNGFLTLTNFMLHRADGTGAHTDGDLIGVRFPHRIELEDAPMGPMQDHDLFDNPNVKGLIQLVIVEVKYTNAPSRLNDSWQRDSTVLCEFLKRIGLFPNADVENNIAQDLYHNWFYRDNSHLVRVLSVAKRIEPPPHPMMPLPIAQQLSWEQHILPFIYKRFKKYARQKSYHPQWDEHGQRLYEWATGQQMGVQDFTSKVFEAMNEHNRNQR